MFSFQPMFQQGINFTGCLFKDGRDIGGIGNDELKFYVRLKRKLNISEMKELMYFIEGLHEDFKHKEIDIVFLMKGTK